MGDTSSTSATGDDLAAQTTVGLGLPAGGTPSSIESTPEPSADPDADADAPAPDQAQTQKRKGGRKPIYATSEERKQRNRQAQAAFRERRTEYIKQLEAQIKQNEDSLRSLQQSQRSAADECLMLRYKNSLLERILLEKGIDVQAELQVKTGSPTVGPRPASPQLATPPVQPQPPLQRAAVHRQYARRSFANVNQRVVPGPVSAPHVPHDSSVIAHSPQGQPTPSSHASSPTAMSVKSPGLTPQSNIASRPPLPVHQVQAHHQQHPAQAPHAPQVPRPHYMMQNPGPRPPSMQYGGSSARSTVSADSSQAGSILTGPSAAAYPSPYQKNPDQSEHDYDVQHHAVGNEQEALDQRGYGHHVLAEHYPTQDPFRAQYAGQGLAQPQASHAPGGPKPAVSEAGQQHDQSGHFQQMQIDAYDPMFDADPFGLSASMHFPTNYSFDHPAPHR